MEDILLNVSPAVASIVAIACFIIGGAVTVIVLKLITNKKIQKK